MTVILDRKHILEQFDQIERRNGKALQADGGKVRFKEIVKKIEILLATGKDFSAAQEAMFFFETGRVDNPRSITHASVMKHPKERQALIDKIDQFLKKVQLAHQTKGKEKFVIIKNWDFGKEVVALNQAIRKIEWMEAKGVNMDEPEYSVVEQDND